jgi:microcystin-dependent protein
LQTAVAALQNSVTALQNSVGSLQSSTVSLQTAQSTHAPRLAHLEAGQTAQSSSLQTLSAADAAAATAFLALQQTVADQPTVKPGTISSFAGVASNIPAGYSLCDGESQLKTDPQYAPLFAAIGTTWGSVDADHFSLPDLRGYFLRGVDELALRDLGENQRVPNFDGSRGVGSAQAAAFTQHTHSVQDLGHTHSLETSNNRVYTVNPGSATSFFLHQNNNGQTAVGYTGISVLGSPTGSAETRPVNVAVHFIIKL